MPTKAKSRVFFFLSKRERALSLSSLCVRAPRFSAVARVEGVALCSRRCDSDVAARGLLAFSCGERHAARASKCFKMTPL